MWKVSIKPKHGEIKDISCLMQEGRKSHLGRSCIKHIWQKLVQEGHKWQIAILLHALNIFVKYQYNRVESGIFWTHFSQYLENKRAKNLKKIVQNVRIKLYFDIP